MGKNATITKQGPFISITRDGREPLQQSVYNRLARELTYTHLTFNYQPRGASDGFSRNQVESSPRKLYQYDSNGHFICQKGFYPKVRALLESLDFSPIYIDVDMPKDPDVYRTDWDAVLARFDFRPRQDECLMQIDAHDYGLIDAPPAFGKTYIMAMIAMLYPNAKVDIVTKRKDVVATIRRLVLRWTPNVGQVGGGKNEDDKRITIYTADSLHKSDFDADILLADECITGDALIETAGGAIPLKDVVVGTEVMCYNNEVVLRPVTRVWSRGLRPVLRLTTAHGRTIRCTDNHLLMTEQGWTAAGELRPNQKILCLANVDAENCSARVPPASNSDSRRGTRQHCENEHATTGLMRGKVPKPRARCANAVAAGECHCEQDMLWRDLLRVAERKRMVDLYKGINRDRRHTTTRFRKMSVRQFLARCLAILQSYTRTTIRERRELWQTTAVRKKRGCVTRRRICPLSTLKCLLSRILALEEYKCDLPVDVCLHLLRYLSWCVQGAAIRRSAPNGLISLAESGWPGGFAMTAAATNTKCGCTPKVSTTNQSRLLRRGLTKISALWASREAEPADMCLDCTETVETQCESLFTRIFQNVCPISVERLITIERLPQEENVYDIEVEECHNFFANGMLVHNCHELMTDRLAERVSRYWYSRNYGFSATPDTRLDNAHYRMEGIFGPRIFHMTQQEAETLDLVTPVFVQWLDVDCPGNPCTRSANPVTRKRNGIWRNEWRNKVIAEAARRYLAEDMQVLIMVDTVEHAVYLRRHLPEATLCYSDGSVNAGRHASYVNQGLMASDEQMTKDRRMELLHAFETRAEMCVIATGVWSTGVSFNSLNVLIRADAGDSKTAHIQIPGRVCRVDPNSGKQSGLVIDFTDTWDDKFARRAINRRRAYEQRGWTQLNPDGTLWTPENNRGRSR